MPRLTHIRSLNQSNPGVYVEIQRLKPLGRSESSWLDNATGQKRVMGMQMVEINLGGEDVRVVTLQDISAGMEQKEIEDWIGLIRVMSHEIMNSLSPITSISTTLKEVWSEQENKADHHVVPEATVRQTLKGLDAIAEQSEGLTTFFESYRVLSRIPDAVKKEVGVCSLLDKVETLADNYRDDGRLHLSFRCPDRGLKIVADEQMMKQVLMNLLKNAVQAVEATNPAEISVEAAAEGNRIVFRVTDNGEGIPQDLADKIFMPFFTTRKKGTGVGLSYSRQVVAMNGGRMEFESCPGRTQFRLVF
jgi:nitrogen fixation/metabolism regulation signal transduction histidine kinase